MREKLTIPTMDVPIIRLDLCSEDLEREVETLNNNNDKFLQIKKAPKYERFMDESRPLIIVDNRVQGITRTKYPTRFETIEYKPLRKGEKFPAKTPCRKNGLGLPNSYKGIILNSPERLNTSIQHQLFVDIPLSSGCTDRLSPNRLPVGRRNQDVLGVTDSANRWSPNPFTRLSPWKEHDVMSSSNSSLNELDEVKVTADRLKLPTRRPSYVAWRERYISRSPRQPNSIPESEEHDVLTDERRNKINQSLEWIKTELMEMRSQDKTLARQLLSLRKDINKLKLQKSCQEHEDLLEDAQDELEELQELSEMCDLPLEELGFRQTLQPLKQIGVTRLNISARRFSTC